MSTPELQVDPEQRRIQIDANRDLREAVDTILARLVELPQSTEREEAKRKLAEAKMWLGSDLKRLDAVAPELDAPAKVDGAEPTVSETVETIVADAGKG